jgi:arylsulfatase
MFGDAPTGGRHLVGVDFAKERMGEYHESYGPATLYVDDQALDQAEIRTMTGHFAITGEGLCIGFDSGDQVSRVYQPEFSGGQIIKIVFDVADDVYTDVEAHFAAAMARDGTRWWAGPCRAGGRWPGPCPP